jgi:hypothetical protein
MTSQPRKFWIFRILCHLLLLLWILCFFLSFKANARVKLAKTGHGQHSSRFVIRVVLLLIVMFYILFLCKCVLPPGVNPIAVDKYINININVTAHQACVLCGWRSERSTCRPQRNASRRSWNCIDESSATISSNTEPQVRGQTHCWIFLLNQTVVPHIQRCMRL